MPRIAFVGDTHGDINEMYKYLQEWEVENNKKIDGVIHVGDFGIYLHPEIDTDFRHYWLGKIVAPIPTVVCSGNHEEWNVVEWFVKKPLTNLTLMPDGEITEFLGLKIGCIWGNYSPKSYRNESLVHQVRKYSPRSPRSTHILKSSVEKLKASGEFDILITHDAPAGLMQLKPMDDFIKIQLGLEKHENKVGCPGFNELYKTGKPRMHFFGHFHFFRVLRETNPLVVCLHCFNYNKEKSIWVADL